jgi:hypothetical protein
VAESGVILPADSVGKALRTETATTAFTTGAGGVVHQQVVSIGDPTTPANLQTVDANGRTSTRVIGESVTTPAAVSWATGNAGATYVVPVSAAGNVTFWLYNGGTAFSGTLPVVAFEQSPDNVNWAPLQVVRSDTGQVITQVTMTALSVNTALAFDAAMEGVAYARVRLVTAPSTGTIVAYALAGGGFFEPSVAAINTVLAPSTLVATATAAVTTALVLTLPLVAGQYHYIQGYDLVRYAGAALTGAAAPVVVTTTNLPGSLAFTFTTAAAIGTSERQSMNFGSNPLRSSAAGVATTFSAPAVTGGLWRLTVFYYTAP